MSEISEQEMSARRRAPADLEFGKMFDICYGSSPRPIPKVYEIARPVLEKDFLGAQLEYPGLTDWCLVERTTPGVLLGTFRHQMGWYSVVPSG